jgi:hypothetical protein
MGTKTWEYLQSSLTNAAIPSKTLEDFIENLCNKLIVAHLRPQEWTWIVSPTQRIQRIKETGEILEFDTDQSDEKLRFESWRSLMISLVAEGINDRQVLRTILDYPHIICTYVRLRFEEDRVIGKSEFEDEVIEVESHESN